MTYKLSIVATGGDAEISQEARLASDRGMLFEEDFREMYRWFADKAKAQGRAFPFSAALKDCAKGKKEKCPSQRPLVRLTLQYEGKEVKTVWPIDPKQPHFFEAIFTQHPASWDLAGLLLRLGRWESRHAFRLLQALEAYAEPQGEKKSRELASLAAASFAVHRTQTRFHYLLEAHLPKLQQERGGKASAFLLGLRDEVYSKNRFDVMKHLEGHRRGRGFSDLLRLLTARADLCDPTKKAGFSDCHGKDSLLYLRRWVLRAAYHTAYTKEDEKLRQRWLAHAGHIFDRSDGIQDRGEDFTLDVLLKESDPNERWVKELREEGIGDASAYRQMILAVIGQLKVSDPYQRRRAYRRLLPLAALGFLRTEVGLALRSLFDLENAKQRKEVFSILWEEGQEGKRGKGLASWADTFFADPKQGRAEAYSPHPKLSKAIHQEFHALRQASLAERQKEKKAWRILLAAAAARLERGDDLRDPAVLSWKKQTALLQAALRYAYSEGCIEGKPDCKGARFILAGRLIRHLTSWRSIPLRESEARKQEIRRHFSNLTPLFKSLSSVDEHLLRRQVWLLERLLPRWSLYRGAISQEEREKEWISRVIEAFKEATTSLANGLKDPRHRVWDRFQALSRLAGTMGLIEDCQGRALTEALEAYNATLKDALLVQQARRLEFSSKREDVLSALGRMYGDKARHCKMDGELSSKVAQIKVLLKGGEDQKTAAQNLSQLHLHLALGGIGQAQMPVSDEALKTIFGVDQIKKPYLKEKGWILLWGKLSLEKDLPCGEVVEKLKEGEEAAWKVFEVLRDVLWLQAQGICINRRRLFSTILPLSERSNNYSLTSAKELHAAKMAIMRRVEKSGIAQAWVRGFKALAEEALHEKALQGREVKEFSKRWMALQARLMALLREKEADWPTEEARFVSQGSVLASSYLSHLYEVVQLQKRQKEADRSGRLTVPSVHPLRYLEESRTEEDIKHLKGLVKQRNQHIRDELMAAVEKKEDFFERRSQERQRIYNALQRAYLELNEMRLEAQKLGLESEIFALQREIVQRIRAVAGIDIEVAKKHEALAVMQKERAKLEKDLRKEGVDLSSLEIKIKALEESLIESEIQGRDKEEKILKEQEKLAEESIKLNQKRLSQIDTKIKAIQERNHLIQKKLAAFRGVFSALDGKLRLLEEQIKKQGEKEGLIREKAALLAEKKSKVEAQFALLTEKRMHLGRKLGVLHEQKKKILEKNQKIAKLWQTRIKETELALATLHTEISARKAVIKLSMDLSASIIKKTEENIAKVRAARAEHERRMAAQRRRSFWSRVASIGFRIIGAVVGTICCGNPMLGVQIGGLVGDFIAKGAIQGDWGGAWKGLGIGAGTMLLTAGIGDLGLGAELASGISNVALRAGVEQLANVAVSSLIQNAVIGLETGRFGDVLENTLKDVVRDLPSVALQVVAKVDLGPNLGKAMEVLKFAHENILAGDLGNIKKLGDPAFLQERALALGERFAKKALNKHAPDLMKAVQKFEDFQSKYNLFPKVQDVFKDGLTAFERHLKQRVQELPKELFQKHLQPEIEGFLRRHTPKAMKDIESALRDQLGIDPKDVVSAIKNQDFDILKKKFADKLPEIQEAVLGGLKKHWAREFKQLDDLKKNAVETFENVRSKVEGVEQEFRSRLSQSLDQIQSFGQSVQGDLQQLDQETTGRFDEEPAAAFLRTPRRNPPIPSATVR
jgi:hypothetical protein